MSLRDKILFFGIIIALFIFVLFGYIFPAEDKLKSENPFIKLKSPGVACSTFENFINMASFLENKDYVSAEKYLDTKKCEHLEPGTGVKIIGPAGPDSFVVRPEGRSIHLFISSSILEQ